MTAEASVLNRAGVALAADSAVTISSSEGAKTYSSADKLFQLSTSAPVGVMTFGNAEFIGVPWETIIKVFRRRLGGTSYGTVEEYAQAFLTFLCEDEAVFPADNQRYYVGELVKHSYLRVRDTLAVTIDRRAEEEDGLTLDDVIELADSVAAAWEDVVKDRPRLKGIGPSPVSDVREEYADIIRQARAEVFGTLPLKPATKRRLFEIAVQYLTRMHFGPGHSGVVFAGFGSDEYLPRLHGYTMEHAILRRPRVAKTQQVVISRENSSSVNAFAQGEAVYAFMEGIDPQLAEFMKESTRDLFEGALAVIADRVESEDEAMGAGLHKFIDEESGTLLNGLMEQWRQRRSEIWFPVVQMVAALPKDELGKMAEALVNLTKFRRRVTPDLETVGGPIDVAIITRGDGFVWVKRKHYFDPELNPRFISRLGQIPED